MNSWNGGKPKNFKELFNFYYAYVKPLYSEVQTQNTLPIETLFELNAAFDHLSVHWINGQTEEEAAAEAFSHLKRSCLDIFKLKVREARRQYDLLCQIDTSVIDNGDFDKKLHGLFNEIRRGATDARRAESDTNNDNSVPAFGLWEIVYIKCVELEKDYFLHSKLNWAKRRSISRFIREQAWGLIIGVVSSLAATAIWLYFSSRH
jgi:hypothetical protein